jgi:hypothetical protein
MDYFYCDNLDCKHYKDYKRRYERVVNLLKTKESELICPYCNILMEYNYSFPVDYTGTINKNRKPLDK